MCLFILYATTDWYYEFNHHVKTGELFKTVRNLNEIYMDDFVKLGYCLDL